MNLYGCEILSKLSKTNAPLSCSFAKKFVEGIVLCRHREKFPHLRSCDFEFGYKMTKIKSEPHKKEKKNDKRIRSKNSTDEK